MPESLIELLRALTAAVDRGADTTSMVDDIEALLEYDPEGSRTVVHAYADDEGMRLWALGVIGDPRDFDTLAGGLDDPLLRYTALAGILARLKAAKAREAELTTPAPLRDFMTPGVDVVRQWTAAPMSARRELVRLLFAPQACGQLRVRRSPSIGHRCPVEQRVWWKTAA